MAQPLLALSQEIKDNKTLRSDASIAQIIGYTMIELARSRGGSGFVLSLVRMISEEVVQGITFNVDGTRNLVRKDLEEVAKLALRAGAADAEVAFRKQCRATSFLGFLLEAPDIIRLWLSIRKLKRIAGSL